MRKSKLQPFFCAGRLPPRGQSNGFFAWSTALHDFDKNSREDDIVDEKAKASICIRLEKNLKFGREAQSDVATADITLRRCQNFKPAPGAKVHWENWDCSTPNSPVKIADGEIASDKNGLVTVEKFIVGKKGWGNKLILLKE